MLELDVANQSSPPMRVCFIHQNLPGQFGRLIKALCDDSNNEVWGIVGSRAAAQARRVHSRLKLLPSSMPPSAPAAVASTPIHPYLVDVDQQIRRGQVVARVLLRLQSSGIEPELFVVHPGWGEALFIKDIFPAARVLAYFEFFYSARGADVGFDPESPTSRDKELRLRMRNSVFLSALNECDAGFTPTRWQKSRFPDAFQSKISLIHEGVDTDAIAPDAMATFEIDGNGFRPGDPVVTYVARNLEPYRGFHVFMRLFPKLLETHPTAHVIVVGADASAMAVVAVTEEAGAKCSPRKLDLRWTSAESISLAGCRSQGTSRCSRSRRPTST